MDGGTPGEAGARSDVSGAGTPIRAVAGLTLGQGRRRSEEGGEEEDEEEEIRLHGTLTLSSPSR